jgi:hypothetical protein
MCPVIFMTAIDDDANVVNLMDALRKSLQDAGKGGASQPAKAGKPKKAASGQREMLMAISGKGEGKAKGTTKDTSARPVSVRLGSSGWSMNSVENREADAAIMAN